MDNYIDGYIIAVLEKKEGISKSTAKPWTSQQFVIEEDHGNFPNRCLFSVWGKEKLDTWQIQKGQHLRIHISINAKEYKGKYYNEVQAWKVEQLPEQTHSALSPSSVPPVPTPSQPSTPPVSSSPSVPSVATQSQPPYSPIPQGIFDNLDGEDHSGLPF